RSGRQFRDPRSGRSHTCAGGGAPPPRPPRKRHLTALLRAARTRTAARPRTHAPASLPRRRRRPLPRAVRAGRVRPPHGRRPRGRADRWRWNAAPSRRGRGTPQRSRQGDRRRVARGRGPREHGARAECARERRDRAQGRALRRRVGREQLGPHHARAAHRRRGRTADRGVRRGQGCPRPLAARHGARVVNTLPPFGAILAGGRNVRYGAPKALAMVDGARIIDRVMRALRAVTPDLILIANDADVYASVGLPMRPDARPGLGALGGIYTALLWAREAGRPGILAVACDMPFLDTRLLARLAGGAAHGADVVVPES